jgi:hypothetical protein
MGVKVSDLYKKYVEERAVLNRLERNICRDRGGKDDIGKEAR